MADIMTVKGADVSDILWLVIDDHMVAFSNADTSADYEIELGQISLFKVNELTMMFWVTF